MINQSSKLLPMNSPSVDWKRFSTETVTSTILTLTVLFVLANMHVGNLQYEVEVESDINIGVHLHTGL